MVVKKQTSESQELMNPSNAIHYIPGLFDTCVSFEEVQRKYKELVKKFHPDIGGNIEMFKELQRQFEQRKVK